MGKYTAYGEKVDNEIQKQLDKICEVIIKYVKPVSILLIGGFGRGEGSIIYKKNKFIPINDYDIYAITSKNYPNPLIEKMCDEASKSINKKCIDFEDYSNDMEYSIEKTFYPDIRVINISSLKKLPSFLKYFEIKYGSTVIYGKNVLKEMPNFNIQNIPNTEGFRFLMNRLSLMIMHFSPAFLHSINPSDKERVINFNSKMALSCAEALLLYSKKFVASYKKRADILEETYRKDFPELYKTISNLPEIVKKYTDHKLKPNYQVKDYLNDWFTLRNYAGEILKFLIFKTTNKKAKNWYDLAQIINKHYFKYYIREYVKLKFKIRNKTLLSFLTPFADATLNLLYMLKIFESTKKILFSPLANPIIPPDLKLFPAALLIIFSLNFDGTINEKMFKKSRKYLKQVYFDNPEIYSQLNWEEMRKSFGTAFNFYGFQRLI